MKVLDIMLSHPRSTWPHTPEIITRSGNHQDGRRAKRGAAQASGNDRETRGACDGAARFVEATPAGGVIAQDACSRVEIRHLAYCILSQEVGGPYPSVIWALLPSGCCNAVSHSGA